MKINITPRVTEVTSVTSSPVGCLLDLYLFPGVTRPTQHPLMIRGSLEPFFSHSTHIFAILTFNSCLFIQFIYSFCYVLFVYSCLFYLVDLQCLISGWASRFFRGKMAFPKSPQLEPLPALPPPFSPLPGRSGGSGRFSWSISGRAILPRASTHQVRTPSFGERILQRR